MTPGLAIILRLEDETDLPAIERTLFTVLAQRLPVPLAVHLMLTRFPHVAVRALRARSEALRHLNPSATILLHNWEAPAPFDVRATLLNRGLDVAGNRYIMLLEVSDLLFADAAARLLRRLRASDVALALGGMRCERILWWGETFLPRENAGLAPDMLCMLDRGRLASRDALIQRTAPGAEIATFIAQLRARHEVDLGESHAMLGLRQLPI